ncbi:MAG: ornithine cyclodeaminase family protein [Thermoleophilia bacterium]|nr:ornithine cyclodeaminase family protein [Thermoleophilia bacterium]
MAMAGNTQLLYLSRADVEAAGVSMARILAALEVAFREKGEGRTQMPPKPGVHPGSPDNFLHAMPAWIPALRSAGVKWVGGFPGNTARGLPYITGLLVLNDPDTGVPIAVMDCTWITAMRTGAASALSARHLARPDSRVLGVLGCGVQGRTHVQALALVLPELAELRAYDIDPARAQAFAGEMAAAHGLAAVAVATPREAVGGCDVVVTAGPILKTPHATIKAGWLEPGAFAAAVDYDSHWDPAALAELDKFTTDDTPQLLKVQEGGYFAGIPPIHADLGELVTGRKPGREGAAERTMACNLGLAIDDMAVAPLVVEAAAERGLGVLLPL